MKREITFNYQQITKHAAAAMEMQKLVFFRDAPAPWQATPPGGPVSLTALTNV